MTSLDHKQGYLQALTDFEELLDNAVRNHHGPLAPRHYDYELRDQIIVLQNQYDEAYR